MPGKSLSVDLRRNVIDRIVGEWRDPLTVFSPGSFKNVADHFKLSRMVVKKIWTQCCETADISSHLKGGNNPAHLQGQDLHFIEALKTAQPSMPYSKVQESINVHCQIPSGTSKSAVGRAVQTRLEGGRWTWKRMSRARAEKFTPENTDYCQDFLDYMCTVDPYRINFFDEAGFRLPDVGKSNYGHSLINNSCVELSREILEHS